ncbi:hypothetical protein GN958_ATG04421, partial [Phytophthora infestans]
MDTKDRLTGALRPAPNCLDFDDIKSAQNVEINGNHQVERVQDVKPVQTHHDCASSPEAKVYELDLEPHL